MRRSRFRYRLTSTARDDVLAIFHDLLERAGVDVADRVTDDIVSQFGKLAATPGIGHRRVDLADEMHRFYLVHSYLIVYLDRSDEIEITRVLHAARDVRNLL